jgi:ABC-type enterochelin transport system permease subunit
VADGIRGARVRRRSLAIVAVVVASVAPLLILVVPAILHLRAIDALLHESVFYPGFSRATLMAMPLAGLVAANLVIAAATRSMRSTLVAVAITTALAVCLILGAVGFVEGLNELGNGLD